MLAAGFSLIRKQNLYLKQYRKPKKITRVIGKAVHGIAILPSVRSAANSNA